MSEDEILENNVINTLRFSTKLTGNKELEKERLAIEKLISLYSKRKDELDKKDKIIDLMAENLTTDYHDKIWVINHYMEEIKTECKNKTVSQNKKIFF